MTTCARGTAMDELEFVQSLSRRTLTGECSGPVLHMALTAWRLFSLEQCLASQQAMEMLWDNYADDSAQGVHFALCAAHWMDLCALAWLRAEQARRSDWRSEAFYLVRQLCTTAGWDAKEIVNMFAWQRS